MDEAEIIDRFKRAHAKLLEYREIIQPAADALAELKSIAVYGKPGCYDGDLGCFDGGIDVVCLHIKEDIPRPELFTRDENSPSRKAHRFTEEWYEKIGRLQVGLTGHY